MREPVAIVGMGAAFPGAPDLATYWRNLEAGVDAITAIPSARIDPELAAANGFTCTRGGFLDGAGLVIDPVSFGIMPVAAASAEPDQMLALHVAAAAIADASGELPRDRTGVILGRGGYLNPGMARLANRVRTAPQLAAVLADLELDADTVERIRAAFAAKAGRESANESAIGLVPNLAASRIANRLDLRGPAYTIDAACASSLLAVDQACRELADHRCDAMIAGGVHVCHDVTFWSVFTQLGALSKSSRIRPFDRRADGIVIGEGCGVVVLKRLADAERAGDRIYATILGCGVSSDGRESSAMRPRADGQLAAIGDAWKLAQRAPADVGLVEAHGTATPTGDEVELAALGQFFGGATGSRAALGSVKSMIGHAMPAAGVAGLIKTALAAYHGVLPPSLHCEEPNEALEHTRFRVLAKAEPWEAADRVAGVSAFGFGGINAHVVLCNRPSAVQRSRGVAASTFRTLLPSLSASATSIEGLRDALAGKSVEPGPMRLAMLDPTPARIALAHKVLDRGQAWRGKSDIWFAPRGFAAEGGKLAFVFPGVEATFAVNAEDVAAELGMSAPEISVAMAAAKSQAATPRDLELRGSGVFALGRLLAAALAREGIAADAIAGHSLGEWTGMVVSEMIPPAEAEQFIGALPQNALEVPDVVFAALGCGAAGANTALEGLHDIAVSHDNCPHQSIICGRRDRVQTAMARLAARGVLCQELPFKSGFHSPLLSEYLGMHRRHLAELALQRPRVPLWSATTCAPYPDEPAQIRKIAIDHLVQPVRFRELVEAMYADGVRAFVQLGVGSTGSFVEDTLRGKEHLTIAAASAKHSGLSQLARVQCALFAEGFLERAHEEDVTMPVAAKPAAKSAMTLDLGVPLVRLTGVAPISTTTKLPTGNDPILTELVATLDEAAAASRAVVEAYRRGKLPTELTTKRALSVATDPYLHDHCFYRQPPGWPIVSDHYPVVPMTMTIGMLIAAAQKLCPDLVPIGVEEIRALRWLAVEPPVEISMHAKLREPGLVDVDLPGYSRATVRFAAAYPPAPRTSHPPLTAPHAAPHTAEQMYADRWMFHGPAYQGVTAMGPVGSDGVDGEITTLPAPGALLDCAGQLMGWWVMHTEKRDRLAMPVLIERVELFAPHPSPGERVQCSVRMRDVGDINVRADLELSRGGVTWARITGWTDRRFDSDDAVWAVLMYPEHNALAVEDPGGFVTVTEHWRGSASRELMMRRYLTEREREDHERVGPRGRRGWLLGRIAIKDAVRIHQWRQGERPLWPSQVAVSNAPSGRPLVDESGFARRGSAAEGQRGVVDGLHVSVAHKDDRAVAIVDAHVDVGIDLERIEPRTPAFLAIAFTPAELALAGGRDAEYARLWAAKEAVAKALGTGMTDPKRFEVRAHGDKLQIGDFVVETKLEGDYAIAWTRTPK